MASELLSSAAAARLLGVGTTSVKRWSDAGLLQCAKTPGRHRRFTVEEVERFRRQSAGASGAPPRPENEAARSETWIELLTSQRNAFDVHSALLLERSLQGSWWAVADELGRILEVIGQRWQSGQLTVLQEHIASERLARGIERVCESLPTPPDAPRALLAVAVGDDHTLGLSLAELTLRESGWTTRFAGRGAPDADIAQAIADGELDLLAFSASKSSVTTPQLRAQVEPLARLAQDRGVTLALGGSGAWPEDLPGTLRVQSCREFHARLAELASRR